MLCILPFPRAPLLPPENLEINDVFSRVQRAIMEMEVRGRRRKSNQAKVESYFIKKHTRARAVYNRHILSEHFFDFTAPTKR
jgi:hypothetical protein